MDHPVLHPAPPVPGEPYRLRWWANVVLSLGIFISAVDATIVNVALPSIVDDLGATNTDLQWIIDAYIVVLAGFILLGGGLADRFGRRGVFVTGFAVFGLGSLLAALAGSPSTLIAARAFTGLGGALMLPPALAIIAVLFPIAEERTRAVAMYAGIGGVGIAAGPVIGGFLLDRFWWGSVFIVNVPACLAAVIGAIVLVPTSRRPGAPRLDVVGAFLSVAGLAAVVYGIIEGPSQGWSDPFVVGGFVLGVALLVSFVRWELRIPHPMFDVRVLRIPAVVGAATGILLVYVTCFGILYLLPQYLQYVQGRSPIEVGLAMLPFGVLFAVLSPRSARIAARFGVGRTIVGGLVLMAVGLGMLSLVREISGYALVAAGEIVYSVGWAALMAPATAAIMNALPVEKAGDGSATNQLSRQVGGAFGIAVIGSVFATIYVSRLSGAVSGLPAAQAGDAERSLGEALRVGTDIGGTAGQELADAATAAFDAAAQTGFLVAAGLTLAGAVFAWLTVGRDAT